MYLDWILPFSIYKPHSPFVFGCGGSMGLWETLQIRIGFVRQGWNTTWTYKQVFNLWKLVTDEFSFKKGFKPMVEAFQKNLMDHNGPLATISPGFLVHIPTTWTGPDWAGVVALCYEMMLWSQLCQVNLAAHLLLLLSSLFKWKVKCAGHIIVYSAEAELASCFVDSETSTVLWRIWPS